jgi:hypothetical protein
MADPEGATAAWPSPLQDGNLLTKREDFDSHVGAALEEDAGGGD